MSPSVRVAPDDRDSIVHILHRYFWLIDRGAADEVVHFFTEAARLTFGPGAPNPGTLVGSAISFAMQARAKQTAVTTRHVLSNITLSARDNNAVYAYSLLTLYRSVDAQRDTYPASVADIEDLFVRKGEQWLIEERTITPVFTRI